MPNHTSILAYHVPEHRIDYVGLSLTDAEHAARVARLRGRRVNTTTAPVTGSNGTLIHYTVISQAV